MTGRTICHNPVISKGREKDLFFESFVETQLVDYVNQVKPYHMEIELTSKCAGSCGYCYASSTTATETIIPTAKVKEVIDEGKELGIRFINWCGGDPLMHPDWFECMSYAASQEIINGLALSTIISKDDAKKIIALEPSIQFCALHIDSIVPEAYNKVHTNPKTLDLKVRGYRNLLEAGFPPSKVSALVTITNASASSIEKTIDWYVDEMGCSNFCFVLFKDEGFGGTHKEWEPSLSEFRKALEYRAKKLGEHWLRIGSSEFSMYYCRTLINVSFTGTVLPCPVMRDLGTGNIYQQSLKDIFHQHRDLLLFNFKIKGPCSTCDNNDTCFGCRATAYHYTGDVTASDPKCFMNPEAEQYYFNK